MTTAAPGSPAAERVGAPSWRDGRLVLGVLLVLGSVLVGARVLATADRTDQVWAADHDLAPGSVLAADDLRAVGVRLLGAGGRYLTGRAPVGYVVGRPVAAGELLPAAALVPPGTAGGRRDVTVAVPYGHLPPDLGRGDQVDVYVTPADRAGVRAASAAPPRLVLRGLTVARVVRAGGLGAGSQDQPVVLTVGPDDVLALVTTAGEGRLDLVRVPRGEQQPLATPGRGP